MTTLTDRQATAVANVLTAWQQRALYPAYHGQVAQVVHELLPHLPPPTVLSNAPVT